MKLPIIDIFHSIQGEGSLAGKPGVFVRTAGCPVRCEWCDTKYAWDQDKAKLMPINEIIEAVKQFNCRHIVVTGGEPLIHDQITDLTNPLYQQGYHITIETSAIEFKPVICSLISISPKLFDDWFRPQIIQKLIDQADDHQLKFVTADDNDVDDILTHLNQLKKIDREKIMLMPRADTREAYLKLAPQIAKYALKHNLNFCPRLQLMLWIK